MKHQLPAGPWHVREHRTSLGVNGGEENLNIATITLGYNRDHRLAEKRATAQAIAAVPTLIEALISCEAILTEGSDAHEKVLAALGEAGIEP